MYFVYAFKSQIRNFIYVGLTSNLSARLERHYNGYERTTKPYRPFSLIYHEECNDRIQARIQEKYWKSGTGKEKLKKMAEKLVHFKWMTLKK